MSLSIVFGVTHYGYFRIRFKNGTGHLLKAISFQIEELEKAYAIRRMDSVAIRTRNLLELNIWTLFCTSSEARANPYSALAALLDDTECIDFALRSCVQASRGSRREESVLTYAEVHQLNLVSPTSDLVKRKIDNVILRSARGVKNSARHSSELSAIRFSPEMQELIFRG
jgi:hypothetical protein